jgi:hypothetical protein
MSYPDGSGQVPTAPPPRRSEQQVHEYVVDRVRDLDRDGPIVFEAGGGVDTGLRQIFPVTYDIPAPPAEAVAAAEGEGSSGEGDDTSG